MNNNKEIKFLNRFTHCKFIYNMLLDKIIKIPTPENWPDKNDSKPLLDYCEALGHEKIYALCFTHEPETIYHWYINNHIADTCCVEFDYNMLKKHFTDADFSSGKVKYKKLKVSNDSEESYKTVDFENIPFSKRWPYRIESEYRFIRTEKESDKALFNVPINIDCINRITTADPWWKARFQSLKDNNNYSFDINSTTLEENQTWLKHMDGLTAQNNKHTTINNLES